MSPDEVISELKKRGVSISRKTLYNWEQWGLIPSAGFRNSRTTEYPDNTFAYAYASHKFLNGIPWLDQSFKLPIGLIRKTREVFENLQIYNNLAKEPLEGVKLREKLAILMNREINSKELDSVLFFYGLYSELYYEAFTRVIK